METPLPATIQPLMDAYLQALEPFHAHFYGIYIHGSIALGYFEAQISDIDVIVLTQREWSLFGLQRLKELHTHLIKAYPLAQRLEIFYVPLRYLGSVHPSKQQGNSYPAMQNGTFSSATYGGLNAVTWWLIKHKGIRLLGPKSGTLPLEVSWASVQEAMDYNLNSYWAKKAKRPWLFLHNFWVEFAVTTLCRILTTLEEGEIIAKSPALTHWRELLPVRWQPLIDEAWRIRHTPEKPSLYPSRLKRMSETRAFITYVRQRNSSSR